MDVNAICRTAGYVTKGELAVHSSAVVQLTPEEQNEMNPILDLSTPSDWGATIRPEYSTASTPVGASTITTEDTVSTDVSSETLTTVSGEHSSTPTIGTTKTTTKVNNNRFAGEFKSDSGKMDYRILIYLAVSLLLGGVCVWVSYIIYKRHQAKSYVLPPTAAEATPLNHITSRS